MLVHMDGFDSYINDSDLYSEYNNGWTGNTAITTTGGRYGTCGITFSGTAAFLSRILPSSLTQLWIGFAFNPTSFAASGTELIQFISGAGIEFSVTYYGGTLKFYRGDMTTLVASFSITITTGAWHWFEFHYTYGASAGVVECWVDNVQLGTFTGNTTNAGGGAIYVIEIGNNHGSANAMVGTLDDMYILDASTGANTTRLGDCRVEVLGPTANAGPNNGTASSGSNYACVNEAQYNTTNYVTLTDTTGQEELYTPATLSTNPFQIFGVRPLLVGQKIDAGSAALKPAIVSGGVASLGTAVQMTTNWLRAYSIFETDPNTGVAWTGAGINAASFGASVA